MTSMTLVTGETTIRPVRTAAAWRVGDLGTSITPYAAGSAVSLRPVRPGDAILIEEMHRRLSPESLYARYFQHRVPPLDELAVVCWMRPEQGAGWVATVPGAAERVIGLAYYVRERYAQGQSAEVGILVEDQYQGQGIGRRLWQRLHEHAQANQIHTLRVLSDPSNRRVLRLVQGSGFAYQAQTAWELNEYLVGLKGPASSMS